MRFNENPVTEVRSASPASSVSGSSLAPSPDLSTPSPLPYVKFTLPTNSQSLSSYPSQPPPYVYNPSPIPQGSPLPFIPPAPLSSSVLLHPALVAPSLQYDVRFPPSQSSPHLPPAILATPATSPPLPSLELRVGDLPWMFNASPDASLSPGNTYVSVQDVLLTIYYHFRTAVKEAEYEVLGKPRKVEVYQEFERRVGKDPAKRGKGLRRVDFLNGRFRVQGLVRDSKDKDSVWEVIVH